MKDRDTENIFDSSSSLLEVDEPSGDERDAPLLQGPPPDIGGEPDYFTPNPAIGQADARRRALGVLGLVGGGIFMAILISAATGSGNDQPVSPAPPAAEGNRATPAGTATVVAPKQAPNAGRHGRSARAPGADKARADRRGTRRAKPSVKPQRKHRRRRHRSSPAPAPAPAPPPETTYSAEPEPVYVPAETEAPTETSSPAPASPSSGGAAQEFGIEP